ncbi:MAG TPA: NAD-dependent epimerase/dehydratase family protein [Pseudomonadota bacterium]|nr:NAD-dependent epimerase/dehydratase family protein [Pseudomonadota bacterium]
MQKTSPPYVILGCGYVGTRLAQSLLADGVQVRVCARRTTLLEPLHAQGAQVHYLEASRSHQFGPAMLGLDQPIVVYSIPGVMGMPAGEAVRRAASAALRVHARAFIYLGSSAVYGRSEGNSNSDWVDEESTTAPSDPEAGTRLADEAAVASISQSGMRSVILRLAAIYGPSLAPHLAARGVRQRLRSGQYRLFDGGRYFFSRIFVDDLARIIRAAGDYAQGSGSTLNTYVVGDDHPCPQLEYVTWLTEHLKAPMPPSVDSHLAGAGQVIRGRRLNNKKLKRELGLSLLYPTFREGEAQIDACEHSGSLPVLRYSKEGGAAAGPSDSDAGRMPVLPPLQQVQSGSDLGVSLGGAPIGVTFVRMAAGERRELSSPALIVGGYISVSRAGHVEGAGPRVLIPAGANLYNLGPEPAEILILPSQS